MQMMITSVTALVCFALASTPAHAWGRDGHRAVCTIAWDALTLKTRDQIETLLDINGREQFAETCNWADEIRGKRRETSSWHFLDSPPGASISLNRDCSGQKCIVEQINRTSGILRSEAAKNDKAEALKFLAHFVGDIHQPLHVAFKGDQGGNSIKVSLLGKVTNLHSVWDGGLFEASEKPTETYFVTLLRDAERARGPRLNARPNALAWARETRLITAAPTTRYVGAEQGMGLDRAYVTQNYVVATKQIKRAGIRLAGILNSSLAR